MALENSARGLANGGAKEAAGRAAAELIEDGMIVGLGTGSTAAWFVRALGERLRRGELSVRGVATSRRAESLAREFGIPLVALTQETRPDITVDGADEIAADFSLIKGGGGALVQEKIVAASSGKMLVVGDATKEVALLGAFPLPVAIIPFGWETTLHRLESRYHVPAAIRASDDEAPFVTDDGLYVVDMRFGVIHNPAELLEDLNGVVGVAECGLFAGIASAAIIGHDDGTITRRDL